MVRRSEASFIWRLHAFANPRLNLDQPGLKPHQLRMPSDGNDGNNGSPFLSLDFIGAVVPEDAISARGVVLGIGFEEFFAIRARERSEFVSMKARVVRIYFKVSDSLPNLIEESSIRGRIFQFRELLIRSGREFDFTFHK